MSLLDEFRELFVIMERTRVSDGEGGFTTTWAEGAEIMVAMKFDRSIQSIIAQSEGVTSVFTFLLPIDASIEYHDVLKRKSDGQCFRITSKSGDSKTPGSSSLNLCAVTAEEWNLTT